MLDSFHDLYGSAEGVRVFRAPGRVNLIGEHTDYNLGLVLPMALELATFVAAAPAGDGKLRIYSEDKRELHEWNVAEMDALRPQRSWTDYPIGVARELLLAGIPIHPANLLVRSTVPEGSGLSSSAALEVSFALAFLNGRPFAPRELALLCQRAEHKFVGIPCGIMDQYVSVFGHESAAIELDCRTVEHKLVHLPPAIEFVAVNSMVKHALAASAYRDRVRECAEAVEHIRGHVPAAHSLRDISLAEMEQVGGELPPMLEKRARHVVSENARVRSFAAASANGDLQAMGSLMVESHRSLRRDYEVSCAELDFLVDAAISLDGTYGSRMTGGGFGGCTVTLLASEAVSRFRSEIERAYEERFGLSPQFYSCRASPGAGELNNFETIPAAA
jgi:galactokinase